MCNRILKEDLEYILNGLTEKEKNRFQDSTILLTGCAGFLGYYLTHFFAQYSEKLGIKTIIGLDKFIFKRAKWLDCLIEEYPQKIFIHKFDVANDRIEAIQNVDSVNFVIHMASIASPTFYRKYPIETVDANIWGLRTLLDYYSKRKIENEDNSGFLFFSSSEVYGDPLPEFIPTDETYRGNVATIGPRACYDEAKRFGETLCYLYNEKHHFPITIVRPFNNFGPGMNLEDKRVPADFAKAVFENRDIEIFSDGTPTRTFCYVTDAIIGYLKALLYPNFDYFNIGIDRPEISIKNLAEIYVSTGKNMLGYSGRLRFLSPPDKEYLKHNPNRRCPNINKAKKILSYKPSITVEGGVARFLEFLKINKGVL